jgi:opacity protein-like surface antigen
MRSFAVKIITITCLFSVLAGNVTAEEDAEKHMVYKGLHGYREYPLFRLNLKGGMGYRIANVPDTIPLELQRHIEGLRLGGILGADLGFFFTTFFGVGLDFSYYGSSDTAQTVVARDLETGQIMGVGPIEDKISIIAVGPNVYFRKVVGGGNQLLHLSIAPVKIYYSDKSTLIEKSYKIKGSAWGADIQLNYDYRLFGFMGLGIGVGYLVGTAHTLTLNGKTAKAYGPESLNQLNIWLGARLLL